MKTFIYNMIKNIWLLYKSGELKVQAWVWNKNWILLYWYEEYYKKYIFWRNSDRQLFIKVNQYADEDWNDYLQIKKKSALSLCLTLSLRKNYQIKKVFRV